MRCTLCDGLAVPQVLGRLADGRLVFGWCRGCVETHALLLASAEATASPGDRLQLVADRRTRKQTCSPEPRAVGPNEAQNRRVFSGLAALTSSCGLLLTLQGASGSAASRILPAAPAGLDTSGLLLTAGGSMALLGAAFALLAIDPARRNSLLLSVIRMFSTIAAVAILIGGIAWHDPRRDPWIVVATTALLASSAAADWSLRKNEGSLAGASRGEAL